ncbi:MAG: twin-arginine translocase subunit TatB [Acidimicrobiia bacterium]|nr:twin-arginine translocase subunit TatB [Acidimicrobiia bacterium]MYC58477.1 twin-arginine translocase subunit TatB [Acidimicrobiia bacterium]MYG94235.1 twin-arginine translocase subunit TatB [Acidimicrobiia bacterium]MYI30417.1 twin-arginine translocase subunit TatB [Acidimicrobiia bacterium]
MGNLGWPEITVIVVVALVVLGPDRLPQAAQQLGSMIRAFRKISTGFRQELQNALDEPLEAKARQRGAEAVAQNQQPQSAKPTPIAGQAEPTTTTKERDGNTPPNDSS